MTEDIYNVYNTICSKYKNKNLLIEKLISFYTMKPDANDVLGDFLYRNLIIENKFDPLKTFQLIGLIHQKNKEDIKLFNTDERKHYGIFYTDYNLAYLITKITLSNYDKDQLLNLKYLEPCSGTGIFVIAFIDYIFDNNKFISRKQIQKVINNIFCADIDAGAIEILVKFLPIYIKFKYKFDVDINPANFYKGNLLFNIKNNIIIKNNPNIIFNIKEGFDVIITNPPYKLLKENSGKYQNGNPDSVPIKELLRFIRENHIYRLNEGTLNYYKIFTEEIIENYSHRNSSIGLLIPVTLLNDKQSEKLRKHILNSYNINKIYIIPEKNDFFPEISQAFCFFSIDKSTKGKVIEINPKVLNKDDFQNKSLKISINTIKEISESMPIIIENQMGWQIIKKIDQNKKIRDIDFIKNFRGELDLTLNKGYLTKEKTRYSLMRGNNVGEFAHTIGEFYVDEKFVRVLSEKAKHLKMERLVCQQISNIHANKRLKFAKIKSDIILGNSCNYLLLDDNLFGNNNLSLDYLLGLMNSLLLDWRFKIANSNNHISNYEISELPIVFPTKGQKKSIESLVNKLNTSKQNNLLAKLNYEIFNLYNLTKNESFYILDKYGNLDLINEIKILY